MDLILVTLASALAGFVDAIVGGGGLISGIAVALKSLRPHVRVVGVESAAAPVEAVAPAPAPVDAAPEPVADILAVEAPKAAVQA
mgnify:CR=1 FL=1